MPDTYLDSVSFRVASPTVDQMVAAGVRGILGYSRVSTPPRSYIDECVARGIGFSPIFETQGERASAGYDAGRADGDAAAGDLDGIGVPDGVRCFVNMADTPGPSPVDAIRDYAAGFAETFPVKWQLGQYGNLGALRAAQAGSPRFDRLWAVETWGAPSGSVEDHWQFWLGQPDVVLVQMANVPPPLAGTDTDWLVPGRVLDGWGDALVPPTVHGFRYPLDGPMRVNSPWGPRDGSFHYGIDLWARDGDPCYAVAAGTVFVVASETAGGNVCTVYFDHPPTPAAEKFGYMHLDHAVVAPQQHVEAGDLIGYCDSTGAGITGPHLHFWIGNNANVGAIDPTPFLLAGPAPAPVDWDQLAAASAALRGGNSAMLIPNFLGNEISMQVNVHGDLIHNARSSFGVPLVSGEVLARKCDRAVQPNGRVDGQHLIVTIASEAGDERRIVYLAEKGGWVTDPGNAEWKIGSDA